MKRHSKRVLAIFCAMIMLCFTACNSQPVFQFVDDVDTNPEYLSFFSTYEYAGNSVAKYWSDHFIELYNKKVYIKFNGANYYTEGTTLSYRELLLKRLESSSPDDLFIVNAEDVHDFARKGYLMDLSNMNFVKNLSDVARYQSTYNGKVFSVPLTSTGFGFAWNVDLLAEHGLTIPQNLGEFWTVCETLKQAGILPYGGNKGYGLTVPAMCVGLSTLYGSSDQEQKLNDLNDGTTKISYYIRQGYEFLSTMIDSGYMNAEQSLSSTPRGNDLDLFVSGQCGFICIGLGETERVKPSFQWKLTGLPVLTNGSVAVYGANHRLAANPNSKNLDTVCRFIEMVGTAEALTISASLDGTMSSAASGTSGVAESELALAELLRREGQIPNQDFSLNFNTWDSIRDVARTICAGTSINDACIMLDELQMNNLQHNRATTWSYQ